jgi:hypothetical protein
MFNISKYLEKFKIVGHSETVVKESLIEAIFKESQVVLTKKDVDIRSGVAYIKTHSLMKNQIQIKKAKILETVNARAEKPLSDIR